MPAPRFKIPPVVTVLLMGGLMWATAWAAPDFGFTLPGRRVGVLTLGVAGVIIALLGVISFRRAKTTVNPLHPEAASALVVSGIYRLTRNPMYLGLLLVLLGWALFLANALAFVFPAVYVPLMNRLQIRPEEKALAEKFGPGFSDYKSKVRRWL
ncbi:MAG: isoprenylcysteine carboxylmethyltransferase family protein [Lacunisphaera sp.]|nr:isoprenylcysteine carboxylmethyltransferase family protein [Lacunisphaera sp.]